MRDILATFLPILILAMFVKIIAELMFRRQRRPRRSSRSKRKTANTESPKSSNTKSADIGKVLVFLGVVWGIYGIAKLYNFVISAGVRGSVVFALAGMALVLASIATVLHRVKKGNRNNATIQDERRNANSTGRRIYCRKREVPCEKHYSLPCLDSQLADQARSFSGPESTRDDAPVSSELETSDEDPDVEKVMIGQAGEMAVGNELRRLEETGDYILLNDLFLLGDDGATTQIDHIVVSRYGVFVIETKNFKGWIFGKESRRYWTQSLSHCGTAQKYRFQNPLHQNWRHICVLSERLGVPKEYFFGFVVFAGASEFKTEMPENVVKVGDIVRSIRLFTKPLIKDNQVGDVARAIKEWAATVTPEQRQEHVASLKHRHSGGA